MSNIFAPLVRADGFLPINVDTGPIVGGVNYMHMILTYIGEIECSNDAINHYGDALPFDVNGRLVVSSDGIARWDQGIPFTASGAVAVFLDDIVYFDQGVSFTASGHIASGTGSVPDQPPVWTQIPDQVNYLYELQQLYDISPYVSSPTLPITGYEITPAVPNFSIDGSGVITAAVGAAEDAHTITVGATNSEGTSYESFTWTLVIGNVPTWSTIPNQSSRKNELPRSLDVNPYASSDSGPILSFSLVSPPAGFSIVGSVITASAGTVVASHAITVRAVNGVGAGDTSFTWDILEELVPPVWSTIPNQSHQQDELPQTLDAALYASSNSGALTGWRLITPPTGFSVDAVGVVTAAADTALAAHNIVVAVSNDQGETSTSFTWTVSDTLLPPAWSTIPGRIVSEENLPDLYAVHSYVTSNSGPLDTWLLVAPPAGFTIDGAGIVTADATVDPGVYPITVRVSNDTGTSDSAPFAYEIILFYVAPIWSTIPNQTTEDTDLPAALDVTPYVTTNSGPLINWSLVAPPTGFSIDGTGLIAVAAGTAVVAHQITVRVENDEGSSDSDPFTWTVTDILLPPQWSTVPPQTTREDNLPATLDLTAYVTSNDGPLVGWALDTPPGGFTISGTGVITAASGISPATYPLVVQVDNNSGTSSSNAFNWTIESFYTVPQWSTIPDQSTEEQLLPVVLDVKPYVTSNHGPLTNWSLVSPPGGWTIDGDGIITVAAARPVASYSITVRASNDSGSSDSAAFIWDILEEPEPPAWQTIPGRQDRENTLPQNYDVAGFASSNSNSGPLTGWQLVSPPTGFSISGVGVITAAGGTAVEVHSLTVRVSNDVGTTDSAPFNWEIQEELVVPQWTTVPNKQDRINILPQNYNMQFYVSSNAGALDTWRLDTAPAGFSIDGAGLVTAIAAAGVGVHILRVGVSNAIGESLSNFFDWQILEELLPPQWSTIPDQDDDEDALPRALDVSTYVTTNSGPLNTWSLLSPPAGFSISQGGIITVAAGTAPDVHSITVRVFNDEGGADSSAFTWTVNAVGGDEDYQEFNAALGNWSFERAGAAYGWDKDETLRTASTDQPIFEGCGWSVSDWTPDAGYLGIRFDRKSTNLLNRSSALLLSPWTVSSATRTNSSYNPQSLSGGGVYFNEALTGTQRANVSAFLREDSPVNGDILILRTTTTGSTVPVGGTLTQFYSTSGQPITGAGSIGLATQGTVFAQSFMVETGYVHPTGPIETSGSIASRSPMTIENDGQGAGWGATDLNNGFCVQVKFRNYIPNTDESFYVPGAEGTIYAVGAREIGGDTDAGNYVRVYFTNNLGGRLRVDVVVNNSTVRTITTAKAVTRFGDYDMRLRVDPSVGIRVWLTGPGVNVDETSNGSWSTWTTAIVRHHQLGSIWAIGQNNNDLESCHTYKLARLNRTVLSDAEIIAWS